MEDGHSKTVDETLNYFGTDAERGLSTDQIKRNQEKYGPNGESKYSLLTIFSVDSFRPEIQIQNSRFNTQPHTSRKNVKFNSHWLCVASTVSQFDDVQRACHNIVRSRHSLYYTS